MRLNTANRSFFTLIATALVPYGLLGLFGCGLLSVAAYRVAEDGLGGLNRPGEDLRLAVVFFAIVVAGTLVAARSVRRQITATRRLAAAVSERSIPLSPDVVDASAGADLTGRVDVVDDDQPYSFTYGLTSPRVALSRGLLDAVGPDELAAVVQHERYHVRNADTLKAVVARAAPSAFFFLPALRHLRDRYLAGRELAADRAAMRTTGERALAGALFKVLDGPAWVDLGTAAALGGGVLEHRVEQLEEGHEPPLPRVPPRTRWLTFAGLVALVGVFAVALAAAGPDVLSMDGSMPDNGSGSGTLLAVLGSVACTAAMIGAVAMLLSGARHRRAR